MRRVLGEDDLRVLNHCPVRTVARTYDGSGGDRVEPGDRDRDGQSRRERGGWDRPPSREVALRAQTSCDDQFDPNKGAACAQQAVSGKYLFVTADSAVGDRYMPILEKGKIPVIGEVPSSASELKSPDSFPFATGVIQIAGGGTICGKLDKKKPAVAVVDIAAGRNSAGLFAAGLKPYNLSIEKTVPIPPTASDVTTQAASLNSGGIDCIEMVVAAPSTSNW
ncbi:ABC transporter substrate-binding protein [Frankia sp. Cr1]|uniref:ABC transporter substrate-binding protein n=1 Tax=Frankia sp. Cr1 TaxID=3073931 RepID=UPI002AD4B2E1|nr:ABC transporter substrate-binding protein [Frankia sp. Cr1]